MTCEDRIDDAFRCTQVCDSVFFKIWDEEVNADIIESCGTVFNGKYRDVTYFMDLLVMPRKYDCVMGGTDLFYYVKEQIGRESPTTITMSRSLMVSIALRWQYTC